MEMVFLKKDKDGGPSVAGVLMGEHVSEILEAGKCPGWGGHVWNFDLYYQIGDCILKQRKGFSCGLIKQGQIVFTSQPS